MRKTLVLAALTASIFLAACGGGGSSVTVTPVPVTSIAAPAPEKGLPTTAVDPTALPQPAPVIITLPSVVPPSIPTATTTNVTLTSVSVNVKTLTANAGQRGVNVAAFTVAFDPLDYDASIQELVFQNNPKGGAMDGLFTQFRLADANGDICPRFNCYVQANRGEVRVIFVYGWRPYESELKAYALQADVSPTAPNGAMFAFELVGVQMRQWGKTYNEDVRGSALEVTTIVAPPTISSPQGRQIVGATPGSQYEILFVTATCSAKVATGCWLSNIPLYVANASNIQLRGVDTPLPSSGSGYYAVPVNYFMQPGETATWSILGTATDIQVLTQWMDMVFQVDGITLSPVNANPGMECSLASGTASCPIGGKG